MKQLLVLLCLFIGFQASAQDKRDFIFNSSKSESIKIDVSFPNIVLKTWDRDEVKIDASIKINDGRNNDRFRLNSEKEGSTLVITSELEGLKNQESNLIYGKNSSNGKMKVSKNGKTITIGDNDDYTITEGNNEIDVQLEIYVPANKPLTIHVKFGMVEVHNLPDDLKVKAKFGGADLRVDESNLGSLNASTSWGQIFSNLAINMKFDGSDTLGEEMIAIVENGKGKRLAVESDFGNVYLRKY